MARTKAGRWRGSLVPRKRLKGKTTVAWFRVNKKIIPMAKAPGLGLHRARNAQAAPHAPVPGPRCAVCNGIFLAGAVVLPCPIRCDPGQLFHDHCIGQHLVIVHAEGTTVLDANAPGPHLPPQGDAPGHAEGGTAPDADAPGPHLHADLCAEALTRQCFDATGAPLLGHVLRAGPFSLQRFYDRMNHRKRGGDPWATRLLHPWFSSSSDAQRTSLALVQDPMIKNDLTDLADSYGNGGDPLPWGTYEKNED